MLGRVLVLSASAGAGHLRAADAIEKALKIRGLASEVQHVDVLKYTNNVFRHLYSKAYIDLVNKAPEVLGWLYDHLDVPRKNEKVRLAFDRLNTGPFVKFLNQYRPDVAICTHFLPSEIISWLKRQEKVRIMNAVVVTDLDVHAMWLCNRAEHYFVALEETKVHLTAIGVPESKVTVSGIPIDPVFAEPKDARAMRRKHGLTDEAFTILVSAGGFGVGPVEHIIQALSELTHPAQVVVVCGRNDELRTRLTRVVRKLPTILAGLVQAPGLHHRDGRADGGRRPLRGQAGGPDDLGGPGQGPADGRHQPDPGPGRAELGPPPRGGHRPAVQQPPRPGLQDRPADRRAGETPPDARQRPGPGQAPGGVHRHRAARCDPGSPEDRSQFGTGPRAATASQAHLLSEAPRLPEFSSLQNRRRRMKDRADQFPRTHHGATSRASRRPFQR